MSLFRFNFRSAYLNAAFLRSLQITGLTFITSAACCGQTVETGPKTYGSGSTAIPASGWVSTIATSGNVTIGSGTSVVYTASSQIKLEPGFSATSGASFHAQVTGVPMPQSVVAGNIYYLGFYLGWAPAPNSGVVAGYEVMLDGTSLGVTPSTAMPVTGLTPGTTHTVTMRTKDIAGNWSPWITPISVTTPSDTVAPSVPTGVAITAQTGNSFTVGWAGSTDNSAVTSYEVMKDGVSLGTTTGPSTTISGVTPNTRYVVQVRAKDAAGNWSAWSDPVNVITPAEVLTLQSTSSSTDSDGSRYSTTYYANQTSLHMKVHYSQDDIYSDSNYGTSTYNEIVSQLNPGDVFVVWDYLYNYTNQGYTEHNVRTLEFVESMDIPVVTTPATFSSAKDIPVDVTFTANNSPSQFTVSGLPPGLTMSSSGHVTGTPTAAGTYSVTVSATNSFGTAQGTSAWTVIVDTTAPSAPSGVYLSSMSAPNFALNWTGSTDNIGVTGYEVNVNGIAVSTVPSLTASVGFAYPGMDYTFKIRAGDGSGNWSAYSAPLTIHSYAIAVDGGTTPALVTIPGAIHSLVAGAPSTGNYFSGWTVTGPGSVTAPGTVTTTFTAGAGDVTVKANYTAGYQLRTYDPAITMSVGGGQAGDSIHIVAEAPPAGYVFAGWNLTGGGMIDYGDHPDAHVILGPLDSTVWPSYWPTNLPKQAQAYIGAPDYADVNAQFTVSNYAILIGDTFDTMSADYSLDGGVHWVYGNSTDGTAWSGTSTWAGENGGWSSHQQLLQYTMARAGKVLFRGWAFNHNNAGAPIIPTYDSMQISAPGSLPWTPTNLRLQSVNQGYIGIQWDAAPNAPATLSYEPYIDGPNQHGVMGSTGSNLGTNVGNLVPGATYTFKVRARNWTDTSAWSAPLTVNIAQAPVITSPIAVTAPPGVAFQYQITADGSPTGYAVVGTLPPGLNFNPGSGLISGTPTTEGKWTVTIKATNTSGTGQAYLAITIANSAPTVSGAGTQFIATVGTPFTYTFTAAPAPISSFRFAGLLPPGLSFSTGSGTLSGTPTTAMDTSFIIYATNTYGEGPPAAFGMSIGAGANPVPFITSAASLPASLGVAVTYQIMATNGPTSYGASGLPPGLAVNTTSGLISGTPTQSGTWSATISAANTNGTGAAALVIKVGVGGAAGDSAGNDPAWSNVSLLAHGDGANGAVSMVDSSPAALTLAGMSGGVISTDQFKFGGSSLHTDATGWIQVTGSALSGVNLPGDFTIDGWIYPTHSGPVLASGYNGATAGSTSLSLDASGHWSLATNGSGSASVTTSGTVAYNTWSHFAICRAGSTVQFYYNGVQGDTATSAATYSFDFGGAMKIGADWNGAGNGFGGYIDDLRITKGVCRYTSNFDVTTGGQVAPPIVTIVGGDNQTAAVGQFNLRALDAAVWNNSGSQPVVGVPLTFTVQSGGGLLATSKTSTNLVASLSLKTDVDGAAQVYFRQPATAGVTSHIVAAYSSAQATFTTTSLSSGDALLDSDGDGMPDAWETANGLDPNNAADAGVFDLAGDGLTNLQVYQMGGDPNRNTSYTTATLPGGYQLIVVTPGNGLFGVSTITWTITPLTAPHNQI